MSIWTKHPVALTIIALGSAILLTMSVTVVPESNQAVITSYGKVLRVVNPYRPKETVGATGAGVALRIPFVEQIHYVDKRVLTAVMEKQDVPSTDQQRLEINAFAKFRITDPIRMFRTLRSQEALRDQLMTFLGSSLRNELGKRRFDELLSPERGEVMKNIRTALDAQARKYGATIVDVRIKRADLPKATLESAFDRMRSARQQEAKTNENEGKREAKEVLAAAQGEAARIYAESYGKDPGFADFFRAMQSYKKTFAKGGENGDTSVVLSPNNDYLRKFRDGK